MIDRSHNTQTLSAGTAVMSKDGARLGSVKEVTARCFKVDAPFHKDYWLSVDLVETTNDTGIVLELTAAGVAEHQMDAPALEVEEDPMQAITAKPIIDPAEQLEQRARMERELAEQSRALPPHEPSPSQMRGTRAFERIPADHTGFGDLAGEYVPNAPVYDKRMPAANPERGSAISRIAMYAAPILIGSATVLSAFLLIRRIRRSRAQTRMDEARALARHSAHDLRDAASKRIAERPHVRPLLRRGVKRGMKTGRHLAHDGLILAANKIE